MRSKIAEPCEITLKNVKRNANEYFVDESNSLRERNGNLRRLRRTENIEKRGERSRSARTAYVTPGEGGNIT
jgi:hypothetical protein